jgi:hypothetical protein
LNRPAYLTAHAAGGVDENANRSGGSFDLVDDIGDGRSIRQVQSVVRGAEAARRLSQTGGVDVEQTKRCSTVAQASSDGPSDALGRTGYQCQAI